MRPKPKTDNLYEAMSAILEKSEFETESKYFDFRTPVMDGHINIYKSSSKEAETNRFLESNGYRFVGTHGAVTYSASWLYTDRGYHGINLPLESGGKVWLFYEDNCVYIEYWYTKFGKQGGVSQLISPIVTPMLFFRPELNFMEIAQGDWTESDTENFLYY